MSLPPPRFCRAHRLGVPEYRNGPVLPQTTAHTKLSHQVFMWLRPIRCFCAAPFMVISVIQTQPFSTAIGDEASMSNIPVLPNKPDAVNPAIASRLHSADRGRG